MSSDTSNFSTTGTMDIAQEDGYCSSKIERIAPQRRQSVNVASILRGGGSKASSSERTEGDKGGDEDRLRLVRRSSINLATLFREGERMLEQNPPPNPLLSCLVDNSVVQRHTHFHMGTAIYKPEGVDGETEALQVQFTVPTPKEFERRDDTENSIDSKFRQRPVTFGAYYDNHNNEMIPELVEATPPEDKTKEDKWIHRLQKLIAKADPRMQILSTVSACLLTHALINHQPHVDLQIITMLLVTLCGATFPHLITAVGCGVYAGSVSSETIPSYAWVVLLGFITALIWQLVSSNRWILGFSGRLGATAFFSMNLTGLIVFGVDRTVSFDRYGSFDSVQWSLEEAFVSLLACIFLSCSAGYFRLIANVPVNPVLVPSAWALFCMLLTSCTDYQFVPSILGGYAVGAYVAMVSETRLSRTWQFAIVGCIAGMWNVLFQPLFLGFGGKGGFTAMVGYSTYLSIQLSRRRIVAARRRRVVDQNMLPK